MYSHLQFRTRLQNFQNLVSSSDKKFPEAFLLVPGLDGRNNKGSTKAIKYLFECSHGEDLFKGSFNDDSLDDVIVLIQESKVSIFWGNTAKENFGKMVFSAYPMCTEYVTTPAEDNEVDLFQLRKCESFKKIILSCLPIGCSVGIPVPIGYDDVLDIESWPLLQSFALDTVVCPTGFFTASYKVVDITTELEVIFRSVDTHVIDSTSFSMRCIFMHSQQLLSILNTKNSYPRSLLTAEDILGPYDSLYDFGEMGTVYPADTTLRPILLLGSDTSLLGTCPNFHDLANAHWKEKVVGDSIHFTVEACDPRSGLRWCRTYFLRHGCSLPLVQEYVAGSDDRTEDGYEDDDESAMSGGIHSSTFERQLDPNGTSFPSNGVSKVDKYLWRLQQIYIKLFIALQVSLTSAFMNQADVLNAGDEISASVNSIMKGRSSISFDRSIDAVKLRSHERLQVHMELMNGVGQVVAIEDVDDMGGQCYAFVRLSVHGIHTSVSDETDAATATTASVSVGDTFVFSPNLSSRNKSLTSRLLDLSDRINITGRVPYFRSFVANGSEDSSARRLLTCTTNRHMLASLELDKPMDVKGTGLIRAEMISELPYLPYFSIDIRPFTSGFVVEKLDGLYCNPIMVSFGLHVEKVWSLGLADCINYTMMGSRSRLDSFPLIMHDGLLLVMKMKSFGATVQPASVFSLPNEIVEVKRLFKQNPLARGLPFCGFKLADQSSPQFMAIVLKFDSSMKLAEGMAEILASWRVAFRIHDIEESRISILDNKKKHDVGEIPSQIMQNLLSLVDSWSYDSGKQSFGSSVQEQVMSGSSNAKPPEIDILNDLSIPNFLDVVSVVKKDNQLVGSGQLSLKISFLHSELNRLHRQKGELFDESKESDLYRSSLEKIKASLVTKPKMIVISSHAGCASAVIVSHLKARLKANSNIRLNIVSVCLDFNRLSSIESSEDVGGWIANTILRAAACLSPDLNCVIIINLIISSNVNAEFASILTFLDFFGIVEVTISIISPNSVLDCNLYDDSTTKSKLDTSETTRLRDVDSFWDSASLELCHSCDIVCFVGGSRDKLKQNKDAITTPDRIRNYCKVVNPTAIFVGVNISSLWFDDDLILSLLARLTLGEASTSEFDIRFLSKERRQFLDLILTGIPKLCIRAKAPCLDGIQLGSFTLSVLPNDTLALHDANSFPKDLFNSKKSQAEVWSIATLSVFLKELFSEAIVSDTVSDKEFWRIPNRNSSGFSRAVMLAKVKVMTSKQSKLGIERLSCGIHAIKQIGLNEKYLKLGIKGSFNSLKLNIRSIHGVVRLKSYKKFVSGNLTATSGSSNSLFKSGVGSSNDIEFKNIYVEACAGSIVIREADDLDGNVELDKLYLQGSFTTLEEDMLKAILTLCTPYVIEKKSFVNTPDIWKNEFNQISQGGPQFVEFYKSVVAHVSIPSGWWFDGSCYLDIHGNRRECHPNIENIVRQYCDMKNMDYAKFNSVLDDVSQWLL